MKIAYLCLDEGIPLGSSKGAAIHVLNIAQALQKIGNEVVVIAAAGDRNHCPSNMNIHILPEDENIPLLLK